MPLPDPVPGLVLSYAYLWQHQHVRGRADGSKDRPCVVVLAVAPGSNSERLVTVVPITHTPPRNGKDAVEIPAVTKQRLGLDDERSWIVATEVNRFWWPGPDLRTVPGKPDQCAYGGLPRKLMLQVRERMFELHRDRRFRVVARDRDRDEHER